MKIAAALLLGLGATHAITLTPDNYDEAVAGKVMYARRKGRGRSKRNEEMTMGDCCNAFFTRFSTRGCYITSFVVHVVLSTNLR